MAEQSWKEERKRNFERLLQRGREETEQHRRAACFPELVAALEDAIELINDINGCHGCADNSADPDESRRKALAAALAKAKEGALDESQMLLQDLDEETL